MSKYHFILLIILFLVNIDECKPARPEVLPKIIWTYLQPNGNNIIHELAVAKMRKIIEKSRWILQVITPENIFIHIKDHESFKLILRNYSTQLEFIEKIQIIKLFILIEYGGVWIDPSVILFQPLDWIPNLQKSQDLMRISEDYEVILFLSEEIEKAQKQNKIKDDSLLLSTDFILGLKQSPTLRWWLTIFKDNMNKQHQQEGRQSLSVLLKQSLSQLLEQNSKTLQQNLSVHKIWIYQHVDYISQFVKNENDYDSDSITDYFTKYPQSVISKHFKKPQYYFKLGQIAESINIIINPNISKLTYLPSSVGFTQDAVEVAKCAHFLQSTSIIFSNLVKSTNLQVQLTAITYKYQNINAYCSQAYKSQTIKNIFLSLKYLIFSLVFYVLVKVYLILLAIIYEKIVILLKPKFKELKIKLAIFTKLYRTIQEEGI